MKILLFVLAGLLILSLLAFGASVFPIPSGDSHAFIPPALLLKAGGGLRNPISDLARQLDPTGRARYLQYPPLFPWILARLMARPTPAAAFLAIAGLNAMNVVLCALLFARVARFRPGTAALALLGIATLLAGEQTGRPEVLATLWVLLAVHVHLALPPERSWLPAGVILGLLGATHPVGALLLGLLAVLAYAVHLPTGRALRTACGTLATSLAVFAGVLAAGPFGLRETLEGMRRHGGAVVTRGSQGTLVPYWITNPGGTLYALPYLLLLALLVWRASRGDLTVRSRTLFGSVLLPLLAVVWRTGVQIPELSYNVLLFAPLVFAGSLYLAGRREEEDWPRRGTALVLGLTGLGYLRHLVLFGLFLTQGVPLAEARAAIRRLPPGIPLAVTPSLWVVTEDYDRMTVFPLAEGPRPGAGAVVIQQSYTGLASPPEVPGYRLVEDHFLPRPGLLLGVRVANTVPGYGYAVYRPDIAAATLPFRLSRLH